ncbi:MAG: hypothetical protein RIC16_14200 [Rhodospirillales bacterium]
MDEPDLGARHADVGRQAGDDVTVAAYPVAGPLDVIGTSGVGVLDEDLGLAAKRALSISKDACRRHAETYSWPECARLFAEYLAPFEACLRTAA